MCTQVNFEIKKMMVLHGFIFQAMKIAWTNEWRTVESEIAT